MQIHDYLCTFFCAANDNSASHPHNFNCHRLAHLPSLSLKPVPADDAVSKALLAFDHKPAVIWTVLGL